MSAARWLGHAGFLLEGRLRIYVDPYRVPEGLPPADIILLTRAHEPHCSRADVEKLSRPQTIVAGPRACVSPFRLNQLPLEAGETRRVLGALVTAVADGRDGLSYRLELDGETVLHADLLRLAQPA
jgi:L-ascorbate metabolism protein UlaG (beta-lactamase superfamily)